MQVEFNASHINTRITSMNVGQFCRIFTFRFRFWAFFDSQLMNFIWKYVFSDYSRFEVQVYNTKGQYCFSFKIRERQTPIAQLEWWDWRRSINLHRTMNNILMTFQRRSAKVDLTNVQKDILLLTTLKYIFTYACAFCFCLGVSRPFASDTSSKWIDRQGLGKRRTGMNQGAIADKFLQALNLNLY